jgi:hypothetical protein
MNLMSCLRDIYEPNNNYGNATALTLVATSDPNHFTLTLPTLGMCLGDSDWFIFSVSQPGVVLVTLNWKVPTIASPTNLLLQGDDK